MFLLFKCISKLVRLTVLIVVLAIVGCTDSKDALDNQADRYLKVSNAYLERGQ